MATNQLSLISQESLDILRNLQIDGTVDGGQRRIRRGVLRDSSDDATWDEEILLPLYVNSLEALRFIGLKKDAARTVLNGFNAEYYSHSHPTRHLTPYDLIEFATGHLDGKPDAVTIHDDWPTILKNLGVRKSLRQAICDPNYNHIRFTQSAREWATETFKDSWAFLTAADSRIKSQRGQLQRNLNIRSAPQMPQSSQAPVTPPPKSTTASIPIVMKVEDIPQPASSKVILYKGGATERLKNFVRADGTLNPQATVSSPPGDFGRRRYVWYFTKQKGVAWDYAQYAKNRAPAVECGMMILAVPKEELADMYEVRGDEWNTLVWSSRGPNYDDDEVAVQDTYDEYPLLVGPCCSMGDAGVARLSDKNELSQMKTRTGEKAEQWVVMHNGRMRSICVAAKDNVWVQVTHKSS